MPRYAMFLSLAALCVIAAAALAQTQFPAFQSATALLGLPSSTVGTEEASNADTPAFSGYITSEKDRAGAASFPKTPEKEVLPAEETEAQTPPSPSPATSSDAVPAEPALNVEAVNAAARAAIVNVFCISPAGNNPISASGVIIDPRGVVLTNAHVAQYLLLRDSGRVSLECTLRTGSPAVNAWRVEVLYVSSTWIDAHADEIQQTRAVGTGEHDYALLRITGTTNGAPLPASFPYLAPDSGSAAAYPGQQVLVASYPAGFLGSISTISSLSLVSTVTTIQRVFTFGTGAFDVASLGGIIVAQTGSSGGAVVSAGMRLVALIATSSTGEHTAERDLHAITLGHISTSLAAETGFGLAEYLRGNLNARQAAFEQGTKPSLIEKLVTALTEGQ